jgi:hypothetical protein
LDCARCRQCLCTLRRLPSGWHACELMVTNGLWWVGQSHGSRSSSAGRVPSSVRRWRLTPGSARLIRRPRSHLPCLPS